MSDFNPPDPNFARRVRTSFAKQQLMKTLGARLIKINAGDVHVELPYNLAWTQQNKHLHAGILTAILDNACGYAAYSLMPAASDVIVVELKINFLAPAKGEKFIAMGKVIKAGRTLTVCQGEVMACDNGEERLIATMQSTIMAMVKKQK